MSAISPFQAAASGMTAGAQQMARGAGDLESPVAVYAQETPGAVPTTVSIGETASRENAAVFPTASPAASPAAPQILMSASSFTSSLNANFTLNPGGWFETGGIPASISIDGIPWGDAGGVAGGNGGGRLPLEIPGFSGYGNAYFLDNADDTLARIVWLYAEYFGNQQRVVPVQTNLPRPDVNTSSDNYGLFGSYLGGSVFYAEEEQGPVEKKEKKEPKIIEPQRHENQMEQRLDTELDRSFHDLLKQKKFFEQKRTPEPFPLEQPRLPPNAPLLKPENQDSKPPTENKEKSETPESLKIPAPTENPAEEQKMNRNPKENFNRNPYENTEWELELRRLQEELRRNSTGDGISAEEWDLISEAVAKNDLYSLNPHSDLIGAVLQNEEVWKKDPLRPTREVISETQSQEEALYEVPSREYTRSN